MTAKITVTESLFVRRLPEAVWDDRPSRTSLAMDDVRSAIVVPLVRHQLARSTRRAMRRARRILESGG